MNAPNLADVLAEVNRLRAERGMEPLEAMPKARHGRRSRCCPVACALGVPVGDSFIHYPDIVSQPKAIRAFIRAFDAGLYPELQAFDFTRASGDVLCECGFAYRTHVRDPDHEWLRVLCDGTRVKL